MKKAVAILLCVALVLLLAACTDRSSTNDSSSSGSETSGTEEAASQHSEQETESIPNGRIPIDALGPARPLERDPFEETIGVPEPIEPPLEVESTPSPSDGE